MTIITMVVKTGPNRPVQSVEPGTGPSPVRTALKTDGSQNLVNNRKTGQLLFKKKKTKVGEIP